jgi:2-C-methyl-D-erythritol 4-phosphate cytidylyltransferase
MVNVIIPAGGKSERYSKTTSKLDELIHGKSVLMHTLDAFLTHPRVHQIMVAYPIEEKITYEKIAQLAGSKLTITPGGKSRAASVYNAFQALPPSTPILIHDAARPNVSHSLINAIIASLATHPVVIPGIPVTDTIKKVAQHQIIETINRDELMAVQTPQGFHYSALKNAYASIAEFKYLTDEAGLLEMVGIHGTIIDGEPHNIKITTPIDLKVLQAIMPS